MRPSLYFHLNNYGFIFNLNRHRWLAPNPITFHAFKVASAPRGAQEKYFCKMASPLDFLHSHMEVQLNQLHLKDNGMTFQTSRGRSTCPGFWGSFVWQLNWIWHFDMGHHLYRRACKWKTFSIERRMRISASKNIVISKSSSKEKRNGFFHLSKSWLLCNFRRSAPLSSTW